MSATATALPDSCSSPYIPVAPKPLRCAVVAGARPCSGESLVACGMRSVGALLARRPVVTGRADAARADRVLGPPGVAIALYRATAHVCARAALAAVVGRTRAVAFPTAGPRVVAGTVDVAGRAAFASSSCIPFWGKGKGTGAKRRGFAHESARARRGGVGGWGSGTMSNILSIRCPTPPAPAHTLLLRRGGGVTYARRAVTLMYARGQTATPLLWSSSIRGGRVRVGGESPRAYGDRGRELHRRTRDDLHRPC